MKDKSETIKEMEEPNLEKNVNNYL